MKPHTGLLAAVMLAVVAVIGWRYAVPDRPPVAAEAIAQHPDDADLREIIRGYRRLAHLSYQAAYHSAGRLRSRIQALIQQPSPRTLAEARQAWRDARVDYSQTEVFRFGNWIVDDWDTSINAWPVDEGLLDYVATDYAASPSNPLARQNLVASPTVTVDGIALQTDSLNWPQLKFIHGGSDVEANVVLGYHAIEFLLWGQDRNPEGPGNRPWTDFSMAACTSGPKPAPAEHCRRRTRLLDIMAEHLYSELGGMTLNWAGNHPGSYGLHLIQGEVNNGLRRMLFGMIRLAGDELSGERMQVPLLSQSPEEEQDCFSDDTHQSLYYNARGLANVYYGRYRIVGQDDTSTYRAPQSLAKRVAQIDPELAARVDQRFDRVESLMAAIRHRGEHGEPFDRQIQASNRESRVLLGEAIAALQALSAALEAVAARLALGSINPQAPRSESISRTYTAPATAHRSGDQPDLDGLG